MNVEDTIVAVSSPPGPAARGIVRLSGPAALEIADRLFSTDAADPPSRAAAPAYLEGTLALAGSTLPAAICLFRGPRSYTGQDVVEFHLLGSPVLLGMLVEACIEAGARRAEAGEFTARAFLAGRFDLSQVHGIAGMIAARSDLQLQAAERLLHGALARTATRAREELADLLSLVEGALDFADEPIEFIRPAELRRRLKEVRHALAATAAAGLRAERWGQLPRVLLLGPPNAGKSSLLNRLSGMDRAICAPLAGTTRDILTAPLNLGEIECLLVDVAGLDPGSAMPHSDRAAAPRRRGDAASEPAEDAAAVDAVERTARAAALGAVAEADLMLIVLDATLPDGAAALAALPSSLAPAIVVANKCDLLREDRVAERLRRIAGERNAGRDRAASGEGLPVCATSAVTGRGCEALKRVIHDALKGRPVHADEPAIALMAEHRESLGRAVAALDRAIELAALAPGSGSDDGLAEGDLIAAELHAAADALGALVGQEQAEDLLGRIFARFCVGK